MIQLQWQPRARPLEPCAAVALGEAALRLGERLLRCSDDELTRLSGIVTDEGLAILGEASRLVWAEGIVYLGRSPAAPGLLVPTALAPSVPLELLQRAVEQRFSSHAPPLIVLPHPTMLIPAGGARRIERTYLLDAVAGLRREV